MSQKIKEIRKNFYHREKRASNYFNFQINFDFFYLYDIIFARKRKAKNNILKLRTNNIERSEAKSLSSLFALMVIFLIFDFLFLIL